MSANFPTPPRSRLHLESGRISRSIRLWKVLITLSLALLTLALLSGSAARLKSNPQRLAELIQRNRPHKSYRREGQSELIRATQTLPPPWFVVVIPPKHYTRPGIRPHLNLVLAQRYPHLNLALARRRSLLAHSIPNPCRFRLVSAGNQLPPGCRQPPRNRWLAQFSSHYRLFIWPLRGIITQAYGITSFLQAPVIGYDTHGHPIRFHSGIDIVSYRGAPIHAAASGRVVRAGYINPARPGYSYGLIVLIVHNNTYSTLYAHLNGAYGLRVSVGDYVHQGDVIGYEGATGVSTGPHLHFEVRVHGTPTNPRRFLD